jgi:hypothetical protein
VYFIYFGQLYEKFTTKHEKTLNVTISWVEKKLFRKKY